MVTMMCPSISCLILSGCSWVNSVGLDYFSDRHLKRKFSSQSSIEDILKLMGTGLRTKMKNRRKAKYQGKDKFYLYIQNKQMTRKSPKKVNIKKNVLKELDVNNCHTLKDSNIMKITEVFKDLEVLKVCNNKLLTDESMKSVARNLCHLKSLDIRLL